MVLLYKSMYIARSNKTHMPFWLFAIPHFFFSTLPPLCVVEIFHIPQLAGRPICSISQTNRIVENILNIDYQLFTAT